MSNFKFIDLFAGIGGFHHALSSPDLGGECVLAVDIDPNCREVYKHTWPDFPEEALLNDIRQVTQDENGKDRSVRDIDARVPDHDVLCAGFPCQPFSKSGLQKGFLDETRGTLFFDIVKIIESKRPKYLILENVRNLVGPRHTETWATIIRTLRKLGYVVSEKPVVLSPHQLPYELGGTPQTRERVFILAYRKTGKGLQKEFPGINPEKLVNPRNYGWRVEEWLQSDDEIPDLAKYRITEVESMWLKAWQGFIRTVKTEKLPGFPLWVDAFTTTPKIEKNMPAWKISFLQKNSAFYNDNRTEIDLWLRKNWSRSDKYTVLDFPESRRKFEWQATDSQPTKSQRDIWKLLIQMRPSGIRVKSPSYVPALVAMNQTTIIGNRKRRLTPVETGRLQGIPDHVFNSNIVSDAIAYRQTGNGVNVGVVRYLAQELFEFVNEIN